MKQQVSVFQGRIIGVNLEYCTLPNGKQAELEIVHHPGGSTIVAIDDQNRIGLVYQYRWATGGWIWELPAGKRDDNEPPLLTAQRELEEELGVEAENWQELGFIHSSPGFLTEIIYLYLATNLRLKLQRLEASEVLEVHWIPIAEAMEWAASGKISDGKSLAGLFRAQQYLS
ncbi:NUDIX hydrolase [Achromatium sp. WMS2]|nr:NUDIX hydrolase [Achromatium sp. WMS2]